MQSYMESYFRVSEWRRGTMQFTNNLSLSALARLGEKEWRIDEEI